MGGAWYLLPGAVLDGFGWLNSLTSQGGTVRPGVNSPGRLTFDQLFTLNSASTVEIQINGATAGTQHDQILVTNIATLGSAFLNVALNYSPLAGDSFVILEKVQPGTISGALFRINYAGGDGNDVGVTRSSVPASTISAVACLTNGWKQITGQGLPGFPYVLEATTNLTPTISWLPILTNNANGAGAYEFVDMDAPLYPQRFYRVESRY